MLVRPLHDGSYELIAGERRWRAAQQAGLDKVPAVIRFVSVPTNIFMGTLADSQTLATFTGPNSSGPFTVTQTQNSSAKGRSPSR